MEEIQGNKDGYNGQNKSWTFDSGKRLEFGACQYVGDEKKYQGRPHDLLAFDEVTHFTELQFRYLQTWNRSTKQGQRCRIVCTCNPPTDSSGIWISKYWGAWLDSTHPNPAAYGELRFYTVIGGEDIECENGDPIEIDGVTVYPKSRTFIQSKIYDNPFLMGTGYTDTLQALPEPLRSQMLNGDFNAKVDCDPWQCIPDAHVQAAMDRWVDKPNKQEKGVLEAIGCDPARGGKDRTCISKRFGYWFDRVKVTPGIETPDGGSVARLVVSELSDQAPIQLDIIGIGSSVLDSLKGMGVHVEALNSSSKSMATDRNGNLKFVNLRAEMWWKLREALDPEHGDNLSLPPDPELKIELCSPKWIIKSNGIQIEAKADVKKRIGKSTDKADCVVYANRRTPSKVLTGEAQEAIIPTGDWGWG